jgi:hypothetical protein
MMVRGLVTALTGLLPLALGCASVDVTIDARPGTDFSRYVTYMQEPAPEVQTPGYAPLVGSEVQSAIAESLDAKGYRAAPAGDADLKVVFHISSRADVRSVNAGDPDTDYYVPEEFVDEALVIEVLDARSNERLWQGVGSAELITSGALIKDHPESTTVEAAKEIMAEFPAR